jgi:hypothetical protein
MPEIVSLIERTWRWGPLGKEYDKHILVSNQPKPLHIAFALSRQYDNPGIHF